MFEKLKDPKKKALFQLSLYGVFFLLAFLIMSIGTEYRSNNIDTNIAPITEDKSEKKNSKISYNYEYKINDNDSILTVKGNSEEDSFYYNNILCYNKFGETYSKENNELLDFYFDNKMYNYDKMKTIIDLSEFVEKTTYKDNSEKIVYEIPYESYLSLISSSICNVSNCKSVISISVFESDYIDHILIDLSKFYTYPYTIDIFYTDIGGTYD